jgi:hypothetical protein
MSKVIDRSNLGQLSREDLEYLRVRGQLSSAEEAQYLEGSVVLAPQGIPLSQRPNTGDVGPELDEEAGARKVAADRAGMVLGSTPAAPGQPVNVHGAVPPEVPDEDEGLGPEDYEDASKKELQTELRSREIPYPSNATKPDLIDLLEADDENEEEG